MTAMKMLNELCQLIDCTPSEREKIRDWISAKVMQINHRRIIDNYEIQSRRGMVDIDAEIEHFSIQVIADHLKQQKLISVLREDGPMGREYTHSILIFKP